MTRSIGSQLFTPRYDDFNRFPFCRLMYPIGGRGTSGRSPARKDQVVPVHLRT
jgi:hypothetical protein